MYDSCVTLGGEDEPWCSVKTDNQLNHIEGQFATCSSTCEVNNCPIGYWRVFPDDACIKVGQCYYIENKDFSSFALSRCRRAIPLHQYPTLKRQKRNAWMTGLDFGNPETLTPWNRFGSPKQASPVNWAHIILMQLNLSPPLD